MMMTSATVRTFPFFPVWALAAVGLLLILEHRYHFPLLYVGLFGVVGLYHNTMRFDVKKPRFLGGAKRKQG